MFNPNAFDGDQHILSMRARNIGIHNIIAKSISGLTQTLPFLFKHNDDLQIVEYHIGRICHPPKSFIELCAKNLYKETYDNAKQSFLTSAGIYYSRHKCFPEALEVCDCVDLSVEPDYDWNRFTSYRYEANARSCEKCNQGGILFKNGMTYDIIMSRTYPDWDKNLPKDSEENPTEKLYLLRSNSRPIPFREISPDFISDYRTACMMVGSVMPIPDDLVAVIDMLKAESRRTREEFSYHQALSVLAREVQADKDFVKMTLLDREEIEK